MRERMLAGQLYLADDPELRLLSQQAFALTEAYNLMPVSARPERRALLLELLGGFGDESELRPPFRCDYGSQITVGARVFANFGLVVLDCAPVTIGDDVQIGPRVQLVTATHPLEAGPRRDKWESAAPVVIGDNAWLGAGVIVCPGVTVGADTVVGAGAVVTKDLPAGVLALGVPATVVREL